MIATITMNVAIDKAYVMRTANVPGAVMRVAECRCTPGGKGLNVARAAKAMGEDVVASGIIGGHAGAWIEEALLGEQVRCDFERVPGESRSCINIIEPDGRQTEFLEPGLTVSPESLKKFIARFEALAEKSDVVTLSGSVPQGVDTSLYPRLIKICRQREKPVLLDTSGQLLIEGVKARPTLIKPNTDEIRQLLGQDIDLNDYNEIARAAQKLHQGGIPYVAVSLGGDGCILACDAGVLRAYPPRIIPVSTTGCGDSMIAGLAMGFSRHWPIERALAFATAVSAANALELGTGCVNPQRAAALLEQVRVEWMQHT